MRFVRVDVDRRQAAPQRGDRLHVRADDDVLPVGHAPLHPSRPVGGAVVALCFVEVDRVMHLGADAPRRGHGVAHRHALHRMNGEDGLADAAVELLVPLHVRAEADGDVVRGPAVEEGVDLLQHPRALRGVERRGDAEDPDAGVVVELVEVDSRHRFKLRS